MLNLSFAPDLVRWWDLIGDPVDQMRRQKRADQYALGAYLRSLQARQGHELADQAQAELIRQIEARWLAVETTSHKAPYDLRITDDRGRSVKVELKAATWTVRALDPRYGRYRCRIPARQRRAADLIVFGCKNGCWHWLIVPVAALDRAGSIEITRRDPARYGGKYRPYLEAWPVLFEALRRQEVPS